jgi:cellulose synthase catalytic subunit (UDP-forming)
MNSAPLLQFESGDGLLFKTLRFLFLAGGALLLGCAGLLPLPWPQQLIFGILSVAVVLWLDRSSGSYLVTLTLLMISLFSTFRYGYWRFHATQQVFSSPGSHPGILDAFCILILLFAETYAALTLFLNSMQTLWPLRRTPVALPDDPDMWPAVDLLIPTLNEPLSLVKFTALAARNIDWPDGRLNVCIVDDGNRADFRHFAEEVGIGYITRADDRDGRAGSINNALSRLRAPYVAIFDCDHVPTRSFLQITLGWFLRDRKLGLLQTPHHLDPPERNPDQLRIVPNQDAFFSSIGQDGNDFWNATFFCGSCAILRRSALDRIGGIAVGTVTEDAHTSLRMQANGWNTAYINIPQAAGLAAGSLREHIRLRVRWARGMAQILRIDNPLFAPGLTFAQRLCCFNAMTHFLYALPRLIFLTAPLICLLFGRVNIPGFWAAILAYALPHIVLSNIASARIQGRHRFSLWNEICESVLAPWIFLPTLLSFLNPRAHTSSESVHDGVVNGGFFDRRTARPFFFLIVINLLGILCAIPRLVQFPVSTHAFPGHLIAGMYDSHHTGLILINLLWAIFNLVILAVATSLAWENRQRRQSVRVTMTVPANVQFAAGSILHGLTSNVSTGGLMIRMEDPFTASVGDAIKVTLPVLDGSATLPATLVGVNGNFLRAQFGQLTLDQDEALAIVLYSRADTWLGWSEVRERGNVTSLRHIARLALHGLGQALRSAGKHEQNHHNHQDQPTASFVPRIVPLILLAVLLITRPVAAQPSLDKPSAARTAETAQAITAPAESAAPPIAQPGNPGISANESQIQLPPAPPDDLSLLPTPFYDQKTDQRPSVPIVFLAPPSPKALQAAGILASWFGILAGNRPVRFPVTIGAIPDGNAIVISENPTNLPATIIPANSTNSHPTLAIRTNPFHPSSKLLILAAGSPDGVLAAATALTLRPDLLQGATVHVPSITVPTLTPPGEQTHWLRHGTEKVTTLPDLQLFANAGYPFTRDASLAGTAVVLPDNPAAEEIELYLTLMGHFGSCSGYPVLGISVANSDSLADDGARDYLVLGSLEDQPAISRLNPSLPVSIDGSGLHIQDTRGFFAPLQHAWWKVRSFDRVQSSELETAGGLPDALIEGIEWPRRSNRSVIVILLRNKDAVPGLISAFLKSSQTSDIAQSVSAFDGARFRSYRIGDDTYRVGTPPWWLRFGMFFADYPWLLVLVMFGVSVIMAAILRSNLRRKARMRLQGDSWELADSPSR